MALLSGGQAGLRPSEAGGSADQSPVSSLSVVCKYWAELDLESMRGKLDEVGLKIAEYQEEAMQNRRKLAESTREFKRAAGDTAAVKGLGPLLKQYQEEIDRLSKRSKHGETAFLELYQKLYEAPDPAPALAVALETASRVADLEATCKKLCHELAEYKAESASIKNQDLTIRKLEDKVRSLEAALEEKGLELEEVRAAAVAEADAARVAQMQEREGQLAAMLAEATASLAAMQKLHTATQNQLFAIQSQSEEEKLGRQAELELAAEELERAQERLAALEREKAVLKQQLDAAPHAEAGAGGAAGGGSMGGGSSSTPPHMASIEESMRQELHTQREVAARLRLEVASLRRELEEAHNMWEARVEGMRSTLQATEGTCRALQEELSMRPTNAQVEELRSQIRLLQAVGYNSLGEDDGGEDGPAGGAADGSGAGAANGGRLVNSLEAMLLQKNRHLEHELTMARLKVVDGKAQLDAALAQVLELEGQLADKVSLVNRLEEDLLASRRAAAGGPGSTSGRGGSGKARLSGILGSDDRAGSGAAPEGGGGEGDEPQEEEERSADSSMIRVVCSQRDRFRAKVIELEEELSRVKQELAAAKSEAAAAKADNVALVERLRYVHGYKAQQRGGGDIEVGADAERRYTKLYEDRLNPFKEFQGEQREKQKSNLHFADKMMYAFGQLVFGSQGARLGTFVYLVILHLLVVGSLMRMTHHSSQALYGHQQAILDHSRHDFTAALHHEGPSVATAAAQAVAGMVKGAGEKDPRLP